MNVVYGSKTCANVNELVQEETRGDVPAKTKVQYMYCYCTGCLLCCTLWLLHIILPLRVTTT